MLGEVVVQCGIPRALAVAPVLVQVAQLASAIECGQAHAGEECVAHHDFHAVPVGHHGIGRLRGRAGLGQLAGALPRVHQRRVGGAHHEAEPGDDVAQPIVQPIGRQGAHEHAEGVG